MFIFRATLLLLVFCISAMFPAESKNCWCKREKAKSDERKIILEFGSLQDKLLKALEKQQFLDRAEKTEFIQNTLERLANLDQAAVQDLLTSLKIHWESYWISNSISISKLDHEKVKNLLKDISAIKKTRLEEVLKLSDDDVAINNQKVVIQAANHTLDCPPEKNRLTWGLDTLQVREAWKIANGTGIVIGSIDSGVHVSHEALSRKYLNSGRSWYDPIQESKNPSDSDIEDGHGTHTIGTMVGDFGIGVAPGAKFIACMGWNQEGKGTESRLLKCGQFMLCPTKPNGTGKDCSKAPRIVNNSWGYHAGQLTKTFLSMVETWIKADIVPVFAIGNSGPKCNKTMSPGNLPETIGVGASDSNNMIAIFSSRGPAPENPQRIKPDITAQGVQVCSASSEGNDLYMSLDGTSMAAPHISGIIALMLSVNPKRKTTVQEVKSILYSKLALDTKELKTNDGKWTCNKDLPKNKPNDPRRHDNYFGRGISNALKAVKNTQEWFRTHPKPK